MSDEESGAVERGRILVIGACFVASLIIVPVGLFTHQLTASALIICVWLYLAMKP